MTRETAGRFLGNMLLVNLNQLSNNSSTGFHGAHVRVTTPRTHQTKQISRTSILKSPHLVCGNAFTFTLSESSSQPNYVSLCHDGCRFLVEILR